MRVLISASTSPGDIGGRKKDFSDCLFKYESKVLVAFGIFLTSFPALELKNLLKWLEITLSSVIVSLSIFRFMYYIGFLFVTLTIDLIPSHIFFEFFLLS